MVRFISGVTKTITPPQHRHVSTKAGLTFVRAKLEKSSAPVNSHSP